LASTKCYDVLNKSGWYMGLWESRWQRLSQARHADDGPHGRYSAGEEVDGENGEEGDE